MRISLIYVQTIEGNNVIPPLGLMYVAAVARNAGHDVQLMDIDPDEYDVVSKVRAFNPKLVGLSFLTTEFEKARVLSHKLKVALSDIILCCGGIHTTIDPEMVLRNFSVDFCVIGEGEVTFLEVCKRIEQGQSIEDISGICLLKNNQSSKTSPRELIKDLDTIPFPARNLVDFSDIYLTFPGVIRGKYVRSTVVMAGRGCCFHCAFCAVDRIFGREYRLRSYESVLEEVTYLQKEYDIKGIFFVDSSLTTNRKWTLSFCQEIIKRDVKFIWAGNTRVDTVDEEMLKLMKRAGCVQIDYGIESGSSKVLEMLNKRITPELATSAIRMTQNAGIRVGASFMIGNPDEEIRDIDMTFDLAKRLKADYTVFFYSIPYPGTRLWEVAKERNLMPDNMLYDNQWNIRSAETPLMVENVSREKLQFYRAKLQNHFFIMNYFRWSNVVIGLQLLLIMIKYPKVTLKAVERVCKSKRWDSLVEEVLVGYRKSLYKYYY